MPRYDSVRDRRKGMAVKSMGLELKVQEETTYCLSCLSPCWRAVFQGMVRLLLLCTNRRNYSLLVGGNKRCHTIRRKTSRLPQGIIVNNHQGQ